MERKQKSLRHSFEHQMLRDYYMKNPMDFVDTMGRNGNLYRVYDAICRERGEDNLYRPEEYSVDMLTTTSGVKALRMTMPIPEESPECYRIYAFYDETGMNPGFFTIERCREDADRDSFICRWLELEGKPMMHMILDDPGTKDEFEHIANLYEGCAAEEIYRILEEAKAKAKPLSEEEAKLFTDTVKKAV